MTTYSDYDAYSDLLNAVYDLWETSEFKNVPVYGNNGPLPNLDELSNFVNFDIVFTSSNQVTIGRKPVDRTYGYIELFFGGKKQTGVGTLLKQRALVKEGFKAVHVGKVVCTIPRPVPRSEANNWVFEVLHVPFFFDSSPAGYIAP